MTPSQRVKSLIKSHFPRSVSLYRQARSAVLHRRPLKPEFTEIYRNNSWNDPESVSGRGSTLARTTMIATRLPGMLQHLGANALLDAACGDFNWMRHVDLGDVKYIGADIVPELITTNRERYELPGRSFVELDITRNKLPRVDVILCRECLMHLSTARITRAISNFKKSGAQYLLCTTHTTVTENFDCVDGGGRFVNLQLPPFNFPQPLELIVEDAEAGKCLGLWRLSEV
jgi:hypothetical protein